MIYHASLVGQSAPALKVHRERHATMRLLAPTNCRITARAKSPGSWPPSFRFAAASTLSETRRLARELTACAGKHWCTGRPLALLIKTCTLFLPYFRPAIPLCFLRQSFRRRSPVGQVEPTLGEDGTWVSPPVQSPAPLSLETET